MTVKVGINGFGRIGRDAFRISLSNPDVEVVAINDVAGDNETLAFLLKYDSLYGTAESEIEAIENGISVDGRIVRVYSEPDPAKIPWKETEVDIVWEATGKFRDKERASLHLAGGVKKVIVTAPAKGNIDATIVLGVNEGVYNPAEHQIVSNASCTTNCLAPLAKVLNDNFGIVKGLMTTVHAYTNDQKILDMGHKDLRRARAAGLSIIPTSTGAAEAVGLVLPELKGRLSGYSLRVPVPTVSSVDLTVELAKEVTADEINDVLEQAANYSMKGILDFVNEPLVSVDFRGNTNSSIIDGLLTSVIGGNLAKVCSWYDNEWGYSCRIVDLTAYMGTKGF